MTSPEDLRRLTRLVDRQAAGRQSLTSRLARYVVGLLTRTPERGFYDPVVVSRVAQQMAEQSRSAQVAMAGTTSRYLAESARVMRASPPARPLPLPEDLRSLSVPDLPTTASPLDVWERPAEQYRYARSTGMDRLEALERAWVRAQTIADDDVALAMRHTVVGELERTPQVVGYRRVIHPELSASGVCGLCLAASDRVYHVGELLPIHGHCRCEVLPITEHGDPGSDLNRSEIKVLYDAAGGTGSSELKKVRYEVQQHSELGPVLTVDGQRFRSVADIPGTV